MKKLTLILIFIFMLGKLCPAQTPKIWPISDEGFCPTQVELCFTVEDYTNVQGFQFSIAWDNAIISNPATTNRNQSLNTNFIPNLGIGTASFSWTNPPLSPATITDNENLFCLKFEVMDPTAATVVRFTDTPPNLVTTGIFPIILESTLGTVDASVSCGNVPVELDYFRAEKETNAIQLNWKTESELDFDYFELEKGKDGLEFYPIAKIEGIGDENRGWTYRFQDEEPWSGNNFYRLKQVDNKGHQRYSNIVVEKMDFRNSELSLFPNPIDEELNIKFSPNKETLTNLYIYDLRGKLVFQSLNHQFSDYDTKFSVNLSHLGRGFYIMKLVNLDTGKAHVQKFVKN